MAFDGLIGSRAWNSDGLSAWQTARWLIARLQDDGSNNEADAVRRRLEEAVIHDAERNREQTSTLFKWMAKWEREQGMTTTAARHRQLAEEEVDSLALALAGDPEHAEARKVVDIFERRMNRAVLIANPDKALKAALKDFESRVLAPFVQRLRDRSDDRAHASDDVIVWTRFDTYLTAYAKLLLAAGDVAGAARISGASRLLISVPLARYGEILALANVAAFPATLCTDARGCIPAADNLAERARLGVDESSPADIRASLDAGERAMYEGRLNDARSALLAIAGTALSDHGSDGTRNRMILGTELVKLYVPFSPMSSTARSEQLSVGRSLMGFRITGRCTACC